MVSSFEHLAIGDPRNHGFQNGTGLTWLLLHHALMGVAVSMSERSPGVFRRREELRGLELELGTFTHRVRVAPIHGFWTGTMISGVQFVTPKPWVLGYKKCGIKRGHFFLKKKVVFNKSCDCSPSHSGTEHDREAVPVVLQKPWFGDQYAHPKPWFRSYNLLQKNNCFRVPIMMYP